MRLIQLKLFNFRQHAETTIDFAPGLTAIVGPNGAGKTTILEAIGWALHGAHAVRGNVETLRWNRAPAKTRMSVHLGWEIDGKEYRVVRSARDATLWEDGAPIAEGGDNVTRHIARVLGMNRTEFFNTYFTGQKELEFLAGQGGADRARFLSRVLGYDRLQGAQKMVRDRRIELNNALLTAQAHQVDPVEVEKQMAALTGELDAVKQHGRIARNTLQEFEAELARLQPLHDQQEKNRARRQTLEAERISAENDYNIAVRDTERARAEVDRAQAAADELAKLPAVNTSEAVARLDVAKRAEQQATSLLELAMQASKQLEVDFAGIEARTRLVGAQMKAKLEKLKPGSRCFECDQIVTEAHCAAITAAIEEDRAAQRAQWTAAQTAHQSALAELHQKAVDLKAAASRAGAEYLEATAALGRINAEASNVTRQRTLLQPVANGLADWNAKLLEAAERRTESTNRHTKAIADIDALPETVDLSQDIKVAGMGRDTYAKQVAELTGEVRAKNDQLTALQQQLEKARERAGEVVAIQQDLRLHNELDTAIGQLREELNARVRPDLSAAASHIISELTDGRFTGLDLDPQYNMVVMDGAEVKPVLSGGEEDIASLALRLACSQLIAERSGRPISLLLLDEIFGSLDEHRRENVVTLFQQLRRRFEQVILITHIDSIRDGLDRVLTVSSDHTTGASKVA